MPRLREKSLKFAYAKLAYEAYELTGDEEIQYDEAGKAFRDRCPGEIINSMWEITSFAMVALWR